jgi:hypothetical protein
MGGTLQNPDPKRVNYIFQRAFREHQEHSIPTPYEPVAIFC